MYTKKELQSKLNEQGIKNVQQLNILFKTLNNNNNNNSSNLLNALRLSVSLFRIDRLVFLSRFNRHAAANLKKKKQYAKWQLSSKIEANEESKYYRTIIVCLSSSSKTV